MLPLPGHSSDPEEISRRDIITVAVRYAWAAALIPCVFPATASAREQVPVLPAMLEFDHDGRGVNGFVLYATRREDGATRRIDLGMPKKTKSGRWQAEIPMLDKGTWRLELAAYNSAGESSRTKADPSEVRSDPPPPAANPAPTRSAPPKSAPAKRPRSRKGVLGKLWSVIVGNDGP